MRKSPCHGVGIFIWVTGAENRIRTDDLLITNELLYQLSYFGKFKFFNIFEINDLWQANNR